MKLNYEKHPALKPYLYLGIKFRTVSEKEAIADCPFCDKKEHFYVNCKKGHENERLWKCHHCGEEGNIETFLSRYTRQIHLETEDEELKPLVKATGLPLRVFKDWSVGWDGTNFLAHCRYTKDTVTNIAILNEKGKFQRYLWDLPAQLYGMYRLKTKAKKIKTVWIVEGHKDAWTLSYLLRFSSSDVVVAVPGAGTFKPQWARAMAGYEIVLCYDNDKAGREGTEKALSELLAFTKNIKVFVWPETKTVKFKETHGYDINDFYKDLKIKYKFNLTFLKKIKERLKPWKKVKWIDEDKTKPKEDKRELVLIDAEDIPELELKWLCKNKFICGGLNMIIGYEDSGKTYIVTDICYHISVGALWPDGSGRAPKGTVIICTNEAHMKKRITKQLKIMGADLSNVKFFEMKNKRQQFTFEEDFDLLKQLVAEVGNVKAIVFDPLLQYMAASGKGYKTLQYADMLQALGLVTDYLDTEGEDVAIFGLNHITKGNIKEARRMVDLMHGSTAFKAKASVIWCVIKVPDDDELRELVFGIGNVCTRPVYGKAFRLKTDFQVHWERGNIVEDVDARLAEQRRQEKDPAKRELAKERILETLAKKGRKVSATHLTAEVCGDGKVKPKTFQNERARLREESVIDTEKGKVDWFWWRL